MLLQDWLEPVLKAGTIEHDQVGGSEALQVPWAKLKLVWVGIIGKERFDGHPPAPDLRRPTEISWQGDKNPESVFSSRDVRGGQEKDIPQERQEEEAESHVTRAADWSHRVWNDHD